MTRSIRVCKVGQRNVTPLRGMRWYFGEVFHVYTRAECIERAKQLAKDYTAATGAMTQVWEYRNGKKYQFIETEIDT